jgi:hypothetical protein
MVRRGSGITFFTVKSLTHHRRSTSLGDDPWPFDPGRIVADMLEVATCQLCHPVMRFVQVETCNGLFHKILPPQLCTRTTRLSLHHLVYASCRLRNAFHGADASASAVTEACGRRWDIPKCTIPTAGGHVLPDHVRPVARHDHAPWTCPDTKLGTRALGPLRPVTPSAIASRLANLPCRIPL